MLNQVVRPFTAKWHRESIAGAFQQEGKREEFRREMESLREDLRNYNRMLAEIAGVECAEQTQDEGLDAGQAFPP